MKSRLLTSVHRRSERQLEARDSSRPAQPTLGRPAWIIANTILIFIASQVAAGIIIESILLANHKSFSGSIAAQFFFVLISASAYILLVGLVLQRRKFSWTAIGLGRRPRWRDLKRAALGFVILIIFSVVVNLLISLFSPNLNQQRQDLGFTNPNNTTGYTLAFAALVIVPPLGEEILMRGYLYSGLRYWWAIPKAALVTSVLFALPHLFEGRGALLWAAAIDTFILSFILIYLREKTGALYAGMLVHALNNLLAFGVYFHGLILLR